MASSSASAEARVPAPIIRDHYPESAAGGFTQIDGTVQFFTRVQALLPAEGRVLDIGAGRGEIAVSNFGYASGLVDLRGPGRRIVGLDIDEAILENPTLDERVLYDGGVMPLEDESIDLIVSDYTLEHIADPDLFCREVARVLKPSGWLCARTPHLYSALVLASSLMPNSRHVDILAKVQPGRQARDVFPTVYGLNTKRTISKRFPGWLNASYTYSPEPAYTFNSSVMMKLMQVYQYVKRPFLGGEVLMVFVRKPGSI